jgi:hypothetical protein
MKTFVLKPGSAPCRDLLRRLGARVHAHAGSERREVQEVAVVLRQVADLVGRDVGRDLRRLHVDGLLAHHRDVLGVHEVGGQPEVEVDVLADQHVSLLAAGLYCGITTVMS